MLSGDFGARLYTGKDLLQNQALAEIQTTLDLW